MYGCFQLIGYIYSICAMKQAHKMVLLYTDANALNQNKRKQNKNLN